VAVARPSHAKHATEVVPDVDPVWLFSTMLASPFIASGAANAAEGAEEGHDLLKGTSLALIHPIVMGTLFVLTAYAGYLGLQVSGRRAHDAMNAEVPITCVSEDRSALCGFVQSPSTPAYTCHGKVPIARAPPGCSAHRKAPDESM
jgi:hypothetical protein